MSRREDGACPTGGLVTAERDGYYLARAAGLGYFCSSFFMEEDRTRILPSRQLSEEPVFSPPPPATVRTPPPAEDDDQTIRFRPPGAAGFAASPQEPDPVTGWLVVVTGVGRGRSLQLGYGIHSVGRGDDQRVSLSFGDKAISRRNHVVIAYDGQGRTFYVSPGSGVALAYLNGQPLLQSSPLRAGDRVGLGKTEFILVPFCGPAFDWQEA